MTPQDAALLELLQRLKGEGYHFVTTTPATHRRVLRRFGEARARSLRDVFGWSLPFRQRDIDAGYVDLLDRGGMLEQDGAELRSKVRVSSLGEQLYLHSAFPTSDDDAVFFGPDTYRFARFLRQELAQGPGGRLVDIGSGSGAGGLFAAALRPDVRPVLADLNDKALRLARINAAAANIEAEVVASDGLKAVEGPIDIAITNPPFIADRSERTYRDGGGMLGAQLSLDWAKAALDRLSPGGRLLLYTGAAIVGGKDRFGAALGEAAAALGCSFRYEEIDPDIFGEMLNAREYHEAERIAAVGAVLTKA
ncbi:MAG TPA: methyltransferase [Caulobacteraceae bacterium]|nr:methyltransferase [Caulobacteraceae bacterium]